MFERVLNTSQTATFFTQLRKNFPTCRNHSINFKCNLVKWFLHDALIDLEYGNIYLLSLVLSQKLIF